MTGPHHDEDPMVARLRRALAKEAEMVHPDQDGLDSILERTQTDAPSRPRWVPWVAGLAAAVVAGGVFGAVLLLGQDDDDTPVAAPTPTTSTSSPASPSPTGEPSTATGSPSATSTPVYWVGQSATRFWLYREFRDVPDVGGPVASAVAAMTRMTPLDPDYSTPWRPASRVEVSQSGDALTVDLSPDAFAGTDVGSEVAALAVQQLVHTATAAAQTAGQPARTVTVTVDGGPYDAWGVVRLGEPMTRSAQDEVQAPIWVVSPQHGQSVPAGQVRVDLAGTAFEGTVLWEVRQGSSVVAEGFTNVGSMGTYGEGSFTVDLTAGTYTLEVFGPDASDGESPEGPRMFADTKELVVR